jgi:hypothetical protein
VRSRVGESAEIDPHWTGSERGDTIRSSFFRSRRTGSNQCAIDLVEHARYLDGRRFDGMESQQGDGADEPDTNLGAKHVSSPPDSRHRAPAAG